MGTVSISGNDFDVYSETADALSDANAYLLGKIDSSTWTDFEFRNQALVSATRWVERALAARLTDEDDIPDPADTPADTLLQEATYEAAFALAADSSILDSQSQSDNIKSVKAGSAEVEFFRPTSGGILPPTAQALLLRYIDSLGLTTEFGAYASGTDGESEFDDQDLYGREEGFA